MVVLLLEQLNKNSLGRVNPTGGDAVARTDKSNSPNSRCSEILQPPVKSEWERINICYGDICLHYMQNAFLSSPFAIFLAQIFAFIQTSLRGSFFIAFLEV